MNYGKEGIKKRQREINAKGPKWVKKFLLLLLEIIFVLVLAVGVIGGAAGIGVFKGIISTAPDISKISVAPTGQSSFVYDKDGNQIAKLVTANANRIPVGYDQMCDNLRNAFVAIEDERFYTHNGIDIQRILSVGIKAIRSGHLGAGGSTITQQLLKNNFFTDWVEEENDIEKLKRKIQEQYLAVQLEKVMSKEDILTNYLNTINCGQSTLGVQAASLRYFGKNAKDLTLSECAVIAAITQKPTYYNPIIHPENNKNRMTDVLNAMLRLGYITEAEYDQAINDNVYDRIKENNEVHGEAQVNSYFVDAVTEKLEDDLLAAGYSENEVYSLMYSGGLRIYSTMDPEIQEICDEEFANEDNYPAGSTWLLDYRLTVLKADGTYENHSSEMFKAYFKQQKSSFNMLYKEQETAYEAIEEYKAAVLEEGDEVFAEAVELTPQPQISFTVEDQHTGHVVAMVGGRGEKIGNRTYNRATQATRQPGSCFKVLSTFAPALDSKGMTLATVFNDAPFNYYDGTPVTNWYGQDTYKGLCSIRHGVWYSLNIVAVKCLTVITPELGFNYLTNFGFTTLEEGKVIGNQVYTDIGQPLALGGITNGVYNIELNAAYASIANDGMYVEPILYTHVTDANGNIILDNREPVTRRTLSEQTAFLMTEAMKDCVNIGTGTPAKFPGMTIAGKTGTTSNQQDVWFAGYTPYYTATCWAGYDNNAELTNAQAGIPKTMFKVVMSRIHEELPNKNFDVPTGIVRATICSKSGKLPIPGLCDACLKEEYFAEGTVPEEYCDVHFAGRVCAYDGLRATDQCPFAYDGVVELLPVEDEALWSGSNVLVNPLDPLGATVQVNTTGYCHHNDAFFAQENWEGILQGEQWELDQRNAAAQAAMEAGQ